MAMVPPSMPPQQVLGMARSLGARMLIGLPNLAEVAAEANGIEIVTAGPPNGTVSLGELRSHPVAARFPVINPSAPAVLFGSSGTTSAPKPVELTHANMVSGFVTGQPHIKLKPTDTVLAAAPYFHVMGFLANLVAATAMGANVVTVSRPEPGIILDAIDKYNATVLIATPPLMPVLINAARAGRLQSLEFLVSSGAELAPSIEAQLRDALPRTTVAQGWGLTEIPGVSLPVRGEVQPVGSVGKLIAEAELRVVDPKTGADVLAGEKGELWARGPHLMQGYRGLPEATAAVIDRDGWFHTGDLGWIDKDGYVFLDGRLAEQVNVGGRSYPPRAFEEPVRTLDGVRDVVAVGIKDARGQSTPVVFVVSDGSLNDQELTRDVAGVADGTLPNFEVAIVPEIPRSPAGKILRRLLVEKFNSERATR